MLIEICTIAHIFCSPQMEQICNKASFQCYWSLPYCIWNLCHGLNQFQVSQFSNEYLVKNTTGGFQIFVTSFAERRMNCTKFMYQVQVTTMNTGSG